MSRPSRYSSASEPLILFFRRRARAPLDVDAVLEAVRKYNTGGGRRGEGGTGRALQVMDAARVFGELHIVAAAEGAVEAVRSGRGVGATLCTEIMRRAACERQVGAAIAKCGIGPSACEVYAVSFGIPERAVEALLAPHGFRRGRDRRRPTRRDYLEFGMTPAELSAMGRDRWPLLVLDRVASLDI